LVRWNVVERVGEGGNRADDLLAASGEEELHPGVLEERILFRIGERLALRKQRRNPERVVPIDPPRKGQQRQAFVFRADRIDAHLRPRRSWRLAGHSGFSYTRYVL
jgi:hypothetical protein